MLKQVKNNWQIILASAAIIAGWTRFELRLERIENTKWSRSALSDIIESESIYLHEKEILNHRLNWLEDSIDDMEAKMDKHIEGVGKKLDEHIESMELKMETKMDQGINEIKTDMKKYQESNKRRLTLRKD